VAWVKQPGGNFHVLGAVKSGAGLALRRGPPGFRDT